MEAGGERALASAEMQINMKENNSNGEFQPKRAKPDIFALPTRQYLDQAILPVLIKALDQLNKERPPEPLEWFAAYLLKQKNSTDGAPTSGS